MSFSAYIMSITGAVCLTALTDVVLPDGETKKYIKGITALIIFAVIITPIPKLVNSEFSLSDFIVYEDNSNTINVSSDSYYSTQEMYNKMASLASENLSAKGYTNVNVTVLLTGTLSTVYPDKVIVDFTNAVISQNKQNIDIVSETTEIVKVTIGISEKDIIIVGLVYE